MGKQIIYDFLPVVGSYRRTHPLTNGGVSASWRRIAQVHDAVDMHTRDVERLTPGAWMFSDEWSQNRRVGLSCLCSSRPLELFWWPVARDVVIYTVSIVTMLVVMFDGLVSALEGGLMTLLYVVYLALMVFNQRIIAAIGGDKRARPEPRKGLVTVELSAQLESVTAHLGAERRHDIDWRPMEVTSFGGSAPPSHDASTSSEPAAAAAPASGGEDLGVDDAEDGDGGLASRVGAIISTPLRLLLKATVPDCREERWAKWYGGRFVLGRASFQPVISPRPPPTHPQVHGHVCYVSVPHWRLLLHYG